MSRLKAQIIKELLCLLRDPKSRVILIVPPLMQLLIFSYAATLEVSNVDMVLLNQDSGRWSQEVIAQVSASSFIGSIESVADPHELRRAIDERKAVIALHFQPDFSRNLSSDKPAAIQILHAQRLITLRVRPGCQMARRRPALVPVHARTHQRNLSSRMAAQHALPGRSTFGL